jgi:CDGSH-type Zn-finger protein
VNIQPLPNGPLLVTGNLEIVSGTGRTTDKVAKTALCRCGQSKNKPYCDGSHVAAGFTAD